MSTDAAIIYSGIRNVTDGPQIAGNNTFGVATINVDGVGPHELGLMNLQAIGTFSQTGGAFSYGLATLAGFYGAALATSGFYDVKKLAPGQAISGFPSQNLFAANPILRFNGQKTYVVGSEVRTRRFNDGLFGISETAQAGFLFAQNPTVGSDNVHYGWIRLRVDDADGNGLPDQVTAIDWAYESEVDKPIRAGQTTPEPSTLALASLALGCAGLGALRRRRQLQKSGERGA